MTVTKFLKQGDGMSIRHSLVSLMHPDDRLPSPFLSRSLQVCPSQPSCWLLLSFFLSLFLSAFPLAPWLPPCAPWLGGAWWRGRGRGGERGDYSRRGVGSVLGITWNSLGRAAWRAGQAPGHFALLSVCRREGCISSLDGSRTLRLAQPSAALLVCFPEQIARGYGG